MVWAAWRGCGQQAEQLRLQLHEGTADQLVLLVLVLVLGKAATGGQAAEVVLMVPEHHLLLCLPIACWDLALAL